MSTLAAFLEVQGNKFGCLVGVHKFHLVSLVLGTFYSALKHALGYLSVPRLFLSYRASENSLAFGKLSPMHSRKEAIHSSAFLRHCPCTPKENLLSIDSIRANTVKVCWCQCQSLASETWAAKQIREVKG